LLKHLCKNVCGLDRDYVWIAEFWGHWSEGLK